MAKLFRYQLLSVAAALTLLSWAGCRQPAAEKQPEAPRVTVAHLDVRVLTDEDDYNGWLQAYRTVDVRARVRGHIKKVYFKDGDIVKEGQPLFDIDPAPFEADIKQAEAEQKSLEAQKSVAEKDVARYVGLAQMGGVSQQQLDKSRADVDSYAAQIAAKRAQIDRLKLELKYSKITADLSGRISKANLTEGNLVNAGGSDPLLTTIVAIDPIYIDFNIDERAMQRYQEIESSERNKEKERRTSLRELQIPFYFGLDTEKGFPHQGKLVFADNKYAEGTGTILVRGEARNPDGKLVPGSRVRVRIPVSDKYEAVVAPDTAVLADQDRRYLLVLDNDNKVLRRDITPGRLLDDGMRVVLPGSGEEKAADRQWVKSWADTWVITVGLQRARINYPVLPLDADGKPIDGKTSTK
jgi:RND family efflux transporter MFP subunit